MLSGKEFEVCLKLDYETTAEYLKKEIYEHIQGEQLEENLMFPEQIALVDEDGSLVKDDVQLINCKLRKGSETDNEVDFTAVISNVSYLFCILRLSVVFQELLIKIPAFVSRTLRLFEKVRFLFSHNNHIVIERSQEGMLFHVKSPLIYEHLIIS